uniref:Uncharacterized protein n=1 Tax=Octopus bimaculoides TaxID=37653 RepID=A0A0L8GJ80_OCTBM
MSVLTILQQVLRQLTYQEWQVRSLFCCKQILQDLGGISVLRLNPQIQHLVLHYSDALDGVGHLYPWFQICKRN